ncbi:MAG TPA: ATP-binding cassette domain-containing protein [Steroidobacteraceae bacterium]|nr:ATP-binding cassette domain-containing protein [Steroidobacteraceae bacterium]
MLSFDHITFEYHAGTGVADIDLRIERGSTTAIVGPSGSGKSTLLKLAIGLAWPTQGHVRINGEVLSTDNALALRQRIGYVIQTGGLFPHLSARDNVGLMARHLKRSASEIDARVNELAELVQLDRTVLEREPQALSGGQRQRVSLMRALMLDPPLLLLDEPLGALDPMVRYELQNDLRRLFAQLGKTVVLVTHDLAEAIFFADRVVLLRDGRIVQQGRYEDLAQSPAEPFVTEFLRAQRRLHEPA